MAINRSVGRSAVNVAEAHLARVAADGSSRHRHLNALLEASGLNSSRDLADCVHLLCSLHGNPPSLIELAHRHSAEGFARDWLARAAEAFERERLFLVRLTSAVGPLPSTPGAAETEAALNAQRNALEILATSERRGCALGAAAALAKTTSRGVTEHDVLLVNMRDVNTGSATNGRASWSSVAT